MIRPVLVVDGDFFFLHVPKTGGSFLQTVLLDHLPAEHLGLDTHSSYDALPPSARELPGFCVVRNPWDWYVSWFHYQSQRGPHRRQPIADPGKRAVWEGALRGGAASFEQAVQSACNGDFDHPLAPTMRAEGLDFYSARLLEIAGEALGRESFDVVAYERMQQQVINFLRRHSRVPPALRRDLRDRPRVRASRHRDYRTYYDDTLRSLVGERTSWICRRFGYEFDEPAPSPSRADPGAAPAPVFGSR